MSTVWLIVAVIAFALGGVTTLWLLTGPNRLHSAASVELSPPVEKPRPLASIPRQPETIPLPTVAAAPADAAAKMQRLIRASGVVFKQLGS